MKDKASVKYFNYKFAKKVQKTEKIDNLVFY